MHMFFEFEIRWPEKFNFENYSILESFKNINDRIPISRRYPNEVSNERSRSPQYSSLNQRLKMFFLCRQNFIVGNRCVGPSSNINSGA